MEGSGCEKRIDEVIQPKTAEKREKKISEEEDEVNIEVEMSNKRTKSPEQRRLRMVHLRSLYQIPIVRSSSVQMDNFERIMENNKIWQRQMLEEDPHFFDNLVDIQKPEYLWIGCADSRVPANQICGLRAGEIFVHRNVANQAPPSDINFLAVLQYAVLVLKVKDIIVSGHYGCGGVKAAFKKHDHGPLEAWLSHIRDLRWRYKKDLVRPSQEQNENLLCQLNVKQQVYNIARVPAVQEIWKSGHQLRIHGLIYSLKDGLLKDLGITLNRIDQIPEQFVITD